MKRDGATISLWQQNMPDYVAKNINLIKNTVYDVIIVGGGITGLTTALELQKAGKKCVLVEAQTIGFGTSGGTTAHLNDMLDASYDKIIKDFGEDNAKLVAKGCRDAIDLIKNNINTYSINCDFSDQKGFLFSQGEKQSKDLDSILEASVKAGVSIKNSTIIPVPIPFDKALVFENQAQFHPSKYLYGLAKAFEEEGGVLVQNCRVTSVDEKGEDLIISSSLGEIHAKNLIYATHVPPGVNLLHFRCAPYRSYAMAVKLKSDEYPEALVYDMYDPYHYYRTQMIEGEKYLIAGGEDHKTAHEENTEMCFTKLESYVRQYFNIEKIDFKWSSQFYEPTDGLPYIGHLPGSSKNVFVATGFSGNGMTLGSLSGKILKDLIVSESSEYKELYSPARVKPVAGFTNFVKEAADVTGEFIGKWFSHKKMGSLVELAPDEAKVVTFEGHTMALYKDKTGSLHAVNPACTHIKCSVAWNNSEKSWDCPCHGSRFSFDGEVLTAPAGKNLEIIELKELFEENEVKRK